MTQLEPATSRLDLAATDVGSVFVSNYPPYSVWSERHRDDALAALNGEPTPDTDLGLYLHIPFCRRRCRFCYFRVFTDKNSEQVQGYVDTIATEIERLAEKRAVAGRPLHFVYFGGGTPSYIAVKQLVPLVDRIKAVLPWDQAEEVAFECEPGTLTRSKLEAIRDIGVTRLSLGIENFDEEILEVNGRAHVTIEIDRVRPWIRELDFPQLNVDLIAGMVGETWDKWRETVQRTIDYDPDSVTVYQMELPFNTVFSKGKLSGENDVEFATWEQKREWHAYAFEQFEAAGFEVSSAYTVLRKDRGAKFVYRDAVWSGADMIGAGVSAFSHMSGVHYQNHDAWQSYLDGVAQDEFPINRAYPTTKGERLIREFILHLKTGRLDRDQFVAKFGVDPALEFAEPLDRLASEGLLSIEDGGIQLMLPGLLRVDQLLPEFYDERYRGARYT